MFLKSTTYLHKTTSRDQGFFQKGQAEKPKFFFGGVGCLEDVELDVLMSWRSCLEDVGLHVLMSWRATHIKKKFGFQVPEVLVSQTKSDLGTLLETSSFKSTKPLHKTTSREQDILQNSLTNCPVRLYVAIFTHSVVYRPTLKNQSFFLGGLPVLMST